MAGVEPMVPASPMPLIPSGFTDVGVSVRLRFKRGRSAARGQSVIHQVAGEKLAILVINRLLRTGLAPCLGQFPLDLSIDEQRIDDLTAVIHGDVFLYFDLAGLRLDFHYARECQTER